MKWKKAGENQLMRAIFVRAPCRFSARPRPFDAQFPALTAGLFASDYHGNAHGRADKSATAFLALGIGQIRSWLVICRVDVQDVAGPQTPKIAKRGRPLHAGAPISSARRSVQTSIVFFDSRRPGRLRGL